MGAIDLKSRLSVGRTLAYGASTASQGSPTAIDTVGFRSACVVIDAGAWTDGSHVFTVQHSDASGSGWEAVADADLDGTEPTIDGAADDDQRYYIGYKGLKRYLRVITTVSGTPSTGAIYGVYVVMSDPKDIPATGA